MDILRCIVIVFVGTMCVSEASLGLVVGQETKYFHHYFGVLAFGVRSLGIVTERVLR